MERWLTDHLIATGAMTESGITRKARAKKCPRCNQLVVVGLDADMCAFEAKVDPQPLNQAGEVLALLEGRFTAALHRTGNGWVIDLRPAEHIAAYPAGTREREDVLRSHICRSRSPGPAEVAPSSFEPRSRVSATAEPPF